MEFVFVLVFSLMCFRYVDAVCQGTIADDGVVNKYGDTCQFKCRCNDVTEICEQTTGECLSGCVTGWMGAGCQYKNVAINQPASQSDQDIVGASLAVDGDETTCSIISPDLNGISWSVEFADITPIAGVVILSTDVEPLQDFAILVSNESGTVGSQEDLSYCFCQSSSADPESPITRYDTTCFEPLQGRYLTILLRSNAQIAVICEVQVYGGRELAFNKESKQSTTFFEPSNANDGSLANSNLMACSLTLARIKSMWEVDLGATYTIRQIVLHLPQATDERNFVSGFHMLVNGTENKVLYEYIDTQEQLDEVVVINLPQGIDGQHVQVMMPDDGTFRQVTLCEVEVFGDCPSNHCNEDCVATCPRYTSVTGDTEVSGICSYGCSTPSIQQCDPTSTPPSTTTPSTTETSTSTSQITTGSTEQTTTTTTTEPTTTSTTTETSTSQTTTEDDEQTTTSTTTESTTTSSTTETSTSTSQTTTGDDDETTESSSAIAILQRVQIYSLDLIMVAVHLLIWMNMM